MKLFEYLKETQAELKEVVFPTRRQTVIFTVLVISISVVVAVTLSGIDLGLGKALKQIVTHQK